MSSPDEAHYTTLHARLRVTTRISHRHAEQSMDVKRRLANADDYGELLRRLWQLHSAYELQLARYDWSRFNINFEQRRRAQWLHGDITALGLHAPQACTLSYCLDSMEAALGCLYVLEGSTLGGQVVQRMAIQIPGIAVVQGVRFFTGHGEHTTRLWNEFLSALNQIDANGIDADIVEHAAERTFQEFTSVLSR